MPETIALAGAALAGAGGTTAAVVGGWIATNATIIAVVGGVGLLAGAVAYTSAQNAKMKRAISAALSQGRSYSVRDPMAYRRKIYGKIVTAGYVVYDRSSGDKNEYRHQVIIFSDGLIAGFDKVFVDDVETSFDSSGNAIGTYAGYLKVKKHLGGMSQGADDDLAASGSGADHTFFYHNCAYLYVQAKWNSDKFPNGFPSIRAEVRGNVVYDPRDSTQNSNDVTTWKYSANSALVAMDYMRDTYFGKAIPIERIVVDEVITAANICDESVTTTTATGDVIVEPRYECNGATDTSLDTDVVLGEMAGSMAGFVSDSGGIWHMRAGAWIGSELDITDDDIISDLSVQPQQSSRDMFNAVRGTYYGPENDWSGGDFPAYKNNTYADWDGSVLWKDTQYGWTTSPYACQRLAKIDTERTRMQITVKGNFSLRCYKVVVGSVVRITRPSMGWVNKEFEVVDMGLSVGDEENPTLYVPMTLQETAEGVYDWNNGDATTQPLAPSTNLPDPRNVPAPSGLSVTDDSFVQPDGSTLLVMALSWTAPASEFVTSGGYIVVEYKLHSASNWIEWSRPTGSQTSDRILDVKVGQSYDVRIHAENTLGVKSAYVTVTSHLVAYDTTPPAVATSVVATAYTGYITASWTRSSSTDVSEYWVYRGTSSSTGSMSKIGETPELFFDDPNVTPGLAYYYAVKAKDRKNNLSGFSSVGGVVAAPAPVSTVAPGNPGAITLSSSGVYVAGDGTVYSYLTLSVPPLPSNAIFQNVLYAKSGSSDWLIAAQLKNTSTTSLNIDDLSPGTQYHIGLQAWSASSGSATVNGAGTPYTAPNKTAGPNAPTSIVLSSQNIPSAYYSSANIRLGGCCISWAPSTSTDVAYYEVKGVFSADASSTTYTWTALGVDGVFRTSNTSAIFYGAGDQYGPLFAGHCYVRAISTSGYASSWVYGGNLKDHWAFGSGSISTQNSNAVATSGIQTGSASASSVQKVLCHYDTFTVQTLSGGSPSESFNLSLANRGFSTKPDLGVVQEQGNDLVCSYDVNNGSSSSTNAVIKVATRDGSNIAGGAWGFSVKLTEFD